MKKKRQSNQMLTLYHNVWQKKISNNNNKIKQETKATVKFKMVKKLCA